jgi:hypothetical protein
VALDRVSASGFKCAGLGLKPKRGSRAGPKPMVKKNSAGFRSSSVDSNPGLLGLASTRSEGTSPAPVSKVVGSFSLGASSSGVACSALQSISEMLPLQVFLGADKLGKRLPSSSPMLSDSKFFQKYYRKAREARKVHLDENVFADSMKAVRPVAQVSGFLSLLPPISDPTEKVVVVLPVQDSASVAIFEKDMVKSPSPVRGFLRQGFSIRSRMCKLISHI